MQYLSSEYFDHSAERAILGTILLDQSSIYEAQNIGLNPDDFHHPMHRLLYKAMIDIAQQGGIIEPITLGDWSLKNGLEISQEKILTLLDESIGTSFIVPKAIIVKERSTVRMISEMGAKITAISKDFLSDPKGVTSQIESMFTALSTQQITKGFITMKESTQELLKEFAKGKKQVSGVLSGYPELDHLLNGMRSGQMIVLAARPSVGKTSLGLNICQNVLKSSGMPVAIISLEMTHTELTAKILASEAEVSLRSIQNKDFRDDEMRRITEVIKNFSSWPLHIDQCAGETIFDIQSKLRKLKMEHGLGFVCIDYLGLIRPHSKYANKSDQIGEISMMIKSLAKELEVPILVLAQLNRETEKGDGKSKLRPALHHLRDSGAIEQDADVVMFIDRDKHSYPDQAYLMVAKNRGGELGDVPLRFIGNFSTFIAAPRKMKT